MTNTVAMNMHIIYMHLDLISNTILDIVAPVVAFFSYTYSYCVIVIIIYLQSHTFQLWTN